MPNKYKELSLKQLDLEARMIERQCLNVGFGEVAAIIDALLFHLQDKLQMEVFGEQVKANLQAKVNEATQGYPSKEDNSKI